MRDLDNVAPDTSGTALHLAATLAFGLPVGIAASRLFRAMLFEASAGDPIPIGWAIVALVCVCLAAAVVPARRAMRVEPSPGAAIE